MLLIPVPVKGDRNSSVVLTFELFILTPMPHTCAVIQAFISRVNFSQVQVCSSILIEQRPVTNWSGHFHM